MLAASYEYFFTSYQVESITQKTAHLILISHWTDNSVNLITVKQLEEMQKRIL